MADFIIIIRSEPDASRDVLWLKRYQVPALAVPVMRAKALSFDLPDTSSFQATVFTSRHAVAAIANSSEMQLLRSLPAYAVGRSTAVAARRAGFNRVITGNGGGRGLVPLLVADLHPQAGALFWPSATTISFDIVASLSGRGFEIQRLPVYAMLATAYADPYLSHSLVTNSSAAVVAMSARSIKLFTKMLIANQLDDRRHNITVIVGSQSIAEAAGSGWANILVAKAPRRSRLLTIATFIHKRQGLLQRDC